MSTTRQIIFSLFAALIFTEAAQAASLDDLYRDIIRSDNQGYLPLFVKNRSMPDILVEEEVLKKLADMPAESNKTPDQKPLNLTNDSQAQEAARKAKQLKWEQTLQAVEQNRVTPLDLDEINYRVGLNDPKAVEVLAWMYTKGIGVSPDFVTAFKLYRQAEKLQIPNAGENAAKIYKAMSPEQRAALQNDNLPQ